MKKERTMNVDIARSITELRAAMKEFLLRHRLYKLLLRGKGLEFEAYRSYAPDDDASSIDWKASKRANTLLVKQYRDERNLKIMFVVDVGENMVFGSSKKLKCEFAAEIVAAFAHLIITSGDRVGYILFSDDVKEYVRPSGGKKHFARLAEKLTDPNNYGKISNLKKAFDFIINYLTKEISSVVIISDFISFHSELEKDLSLVGNKFETVALMIRDPLDHTLPDFAIEVVIEDPKTGQQLLINPKVAKRYYEEYSLEQEKMIRKVCLKHRIDLLELMTNEPFVPSLSEFLKGRVKEKVVK